MIQDMAMIAVECFKHPRRLAIWSPTLGRYICPDTEEGQRALRFEGEPVAKMVTNAIAVGRPPIDPQFKLVFVTASVGTLLFLVLCLATSIIAGREPTPLQTELVRAIADLVKIGFGAIVGLLGGKRLQSESIPTPK